ncbi:MAG: phytanoyl-CoA dioxygenase family protein [Verrucomicrobiota bacterium]
MRAKLEQDGFAILRGVVAPEETARLRDLFALLDVSVPGSRRGGGIRNLLTQVPEVRALADSSAIRSLLAPVLGANAHPVRGLFFDKTPAANWKVPWHQDLFIAVKQRRDAPGFSAWSTKSGLVHVQPPVEVLQQMLTLRLHLDDCGESNGALRVLPGSHREGKLSANAIKRWRERVEPVACVVNSSDAVLMRPLLLHASSPAVSPANRRVIHLEFAGCDLPGGLEWEAAKSGFHFNTQAELEMKLNEGITELDRGERIPADVSYRRIIGEIQETKGR